MSSSTPPPKKKTHKAGSVLNGVSWVLRQVALPIPEWPFKKKKPKK